MGFHMNEYTYAQTHVHRHTDAHIHTCMHIGTYTQIIHMPIYIYHIHT